MRLPKGTKYYGQFTFLLTFLRMLLPSSDSVLPNLHINLLLTVRTLCSVIIWSITETSVTRFIVQEMQYLEVHLHRREYITYEHEIVCLMLEFFFKMFCCC